MNSSLILRTTTRFMLPLLLLFSVFLLVRGHNEPGGGFSGGLVAATAFVLHALTFDVKRTGLLLPMDSRNFIGVGLLVAAGAGIVPLLLGQPFLTGRGNWVELHPPAGLEPIHLGFPLLFDVGVYLVVIGITLTITLPLVEE